MSAALHRLTGLLGELWASGPEPEGWPAVRSVFPALPDRVDDHVRAGFDGVGLEVPVSLGFWRHPDGLAGGLDLGFRPTRDDLPADHVGLVLGALSSALLDAPDVVPALVDAVGPSFLPWATAVTALGAPWDEVAALTVDAVRALGPLREVALPLPDPADPELSLRALVDALLTPSRSGFWPTGAALARIAAAAAVPDGFGIKRHRLLDTLRASVDHGSAARVLDAVESEVRAAAERHRGLGGTGSDLDRTAAWLADLGARLQRGA